MLDDLGQCKRVTIDKDDTIIVEGAEKAMKIQRRIRQIMLRIEENTFD